MEEGFPLPGVSGNEIDTVFSLMTAQERVTGWGM